ncbi:hypothetical protein V5799_028973 [Amblyomma americanum]|uniref:Uncharacterized protein n=1 Tax=Amblyomma americanum TaxID=6943 RepID=A0AAQ4ET58_AMBAM
MILIITVVVAGYLPYDHHRRQHFMMKERWFEATLHNLREFHFQQALRVTSTMFRFQTTDWSLAGKKYNGSPFFLAPIQNQL